VNQTLSSLLDQSGAATALVAAEGGHKLRYDELASEADELAGKLASLGVGRGDRVAIVLANGPQFIRFLFAVTALGATAAPLNPAYTENEYAFYLDDLQPKLVLLPAGQAAAARAAAGDGRVVDIDDDRFRRLQARPYEPASPDDVALVLHTSGTTNRPKQVPLLHRNLIASAASIANFYELTPVDVSYCAMPLFHVHGFVASVLAPLASHGTVVVPSRFAPARFPEQARTHAITWFSAGPTMHTMILEKWEGTVPQALRFMRSCSSALPPELSARCEEHYRVPLLEAYGMTEASHQISSNPLPPRARAPGAVGIPSADVELRIVDQTGNDTATGEVAIRGPGVTPGYVANPEANAASFFDGRWFRTGDRGRIDTHGYLYLEGRIKELIIRGGENISPHEIEAVLLSHASVIDAVAFGVADAKYGEVVGAAVSLNHNASERELKGWCRERLAGFKVPSRIFMIDEIPRTATGKLQRKRIGEQLTRS
jgi:acyl-CoA synthetase (AMP-forming)/AMP-acid ligase II